MRGKPKPLSQSADVLIKTEARPQPKPNPPHANRIMQIAPAPPRRNAARRGSDFAARFEGDEFVIIISECHEPSIAHHVASR